MAVQTELNPDHFPGQSREWNRVRGFSVWKALGVSAKLLPAGEFTQA